MPLFRSKPKPVEGLSDLPMEVEEKPPAPQEPASPEEEEEEEDDEEEDDDFDTSLIKEAAENPAADAGSGTRGVRQKVQLKNTERTISTRLQEAELRRTRMKLARKLSSDSMQETDSIETLLGVNPKGFCLRHPMFLIRSGDVKPPNRLETILDCKLCRQDSMQVLPKGYHRERKIDSAGQVKQLNKNKKGWRDQLFQGFYSSEDDDIDGAWKEQASLRLDQVLIWDIETAPLKCNPQYAKYFRMINEGAEFETVKQICEMDDLDPRTLDFDPELPLSQQLDEAYEYMSETAIDEIRYSASGKGATPEGLEEAVNSLHEAYIQYYKPPDPPKSVISSTINMGKGAILSSVAVVSNVTGSGVAVFSNVTGIRLFKENNNNSNSGGGPSPMGPIIEETPEKSTSVNKSGPIIATPVKATPVKATPVKRKQKKGRFGFGGSSSEPEATTATPKTAIPKLAMDEKEELREKQMQEIREMRTTQKEQKALRREKKKVSKLNRMMLGNENRAIKLQRAVEELEATKDMLLETRLQVDEKNKEGTELIAQIQILQLKLDAVNKHHKALSDRIDEVRELRGIPKKERLSTKDSDMEDVTSTGSFEDDDLENRGFSRGPSERSLGSIPVPLPGGDDKMFSISDKLRADEEDDNDNDTPRTKRRKSVRRGKRRKSTATAKSGRSAASRKSTMTNREPCFDREFLVEKFQEAIRKLITINRFYQQAHDLAMAKEAEVDAKSFGVRKSVFADLTIPDFEDEDWEYYDVEIEETDDEEEIEEESTSDSLGPLPSFGRKSIQDLPMFSPQINHNRKSVVVRRMSSRSLSSTGPPPPPPPVNANSRVRFNDEKLFTVRVIPPIPADLFYTADEIKLFRFEKFMDDNADEFEVVDDEEWKEEEVIEDDEFSFESYDDESYLSDGDEEITVPEDNKWSYDESAFLQDDDLPQEPATTNENEVQSAAAKSVPESTLRERSPNTSNAAGNILDDLIDQVDALIKRKSEDPELLAAIPEEGTMSTASKELSVLSDDGDQDEQEEPQEDPAALTALSEEQIQELRRTFHAFDTNGSGYIEHDELKANLKTVGYNISEEGVNNLLALVDSKDSRLNFVEFIAWNRVLWKDDMKEKFKSIDAKNRGYIDKSQLKAYVAELGHGFSDEELEELCYEMDPEGDDRIQLDDFINVMASSRAGNSYCVVNGELYIEKLQSDFRSMDVDNTGYITRENLQVMAQKSDYILTEKELNETMKELDLDGNGEISIDEFIAASVRIKVPDESRRASLTKEMLSASQHSADSADQPLESSMSLLSPMAPLETVPETPQEHRETEAEKYRKRVEALANKMEPPETSPDLHSEETPKASPKSSADGSVAKAAETKESDNNTANAVDSDAGAPTQEKASLSNFLSKSNHTQQSMGSLSQIDQKRTVEMNRSNEVSMSELSALTSDIFGSECYSLNQETPTSQAMLDKQSSFAESSKPAESLPADGKPSEIAVARDSIPSPTGAPVRVSSMTLDEALIMDGVKSAPDETTVEKEVDKPADPTDTNEEWQPPANPGKLNIKAFEPAPAAPPKRLSLTHKKDEWQPPASPGKLNLKAFELSPSVAPTKRLSATPGKIDLKAFALAPPPSPKPTAPAPAPGKIKRASLTAFENTPPASPKDAPPVPGKLKRISLTAFEPPPVAAAPAPGKIDTKAFEAAPAPVPNAFAKKAQFLRPETNNRLSKQQAKKDVDSKSSMSVDSHENWSDDEGDGTGSPRHDMPLISLGDKDQADKEAGVSSSGGDGASVLRRKRRKMKKKKEPEREPNLDPQFLRETFKQRIRKLISLNRFFKQATDSMFDKEGGMDRKSFGAGNGISLLKGMSPDDIEEMMYEESEDESDAETDAVGSMVSFGAARGPGPGGLARENSVMSMVSTTSFAPPALTAQPAKSAVNTAERKAARKSIKPSFRPETKLHKVKLIPFLTEDQTKELFWSAQDLKLFRFEKFMEDNTAEFELVDDQEVEEEYEEEEYEEISWEEEYDEETYVEEEILE